MATTKDKWIMTRNTDTGNYVLECKDNNFDTQEKKIQVNCGNKNMTGDLVVDVKAKTGSVVVNDVTMNVTPVVDYSSHKVTTSTVSSTISNSTTKGWVESVSNKTAKVNNSSVTINTQTKSAYPKRSSQTIYRDSDKYLTSVTVSAVNDSDIRRGVSADSVTSSNYVGTVYSYQILQSLTSEATGQYCRLYAKGWNRIGNYDGYDSSYGYYLGNIDDGDILYAKFWKQEGSTYYWDWYLGRTNGTTTWFGMTSTSNASYDYLSEVRIEKQNTTNEKYRLITLLGYFTQD